MSRSKAGLLISFFSTVEDGITAYRLLRRNRYRWGSSPCRLCGVSFVSRLAAEWALSAKSIVEVPVKGVDLRRKVYMVRKHMQVPNRALEAFWGFVHDPINADLLRMAEK